MTSAICTVLVERVNSYTRTLRQGDIVYLGALAWIANAQEPLTPQSAEVGGVGLTSIVVEHEELTIVSQTCDLVRDCKSRPFVLLAPIVRLQESISEEARKGRRPQFVWVPTAGNDAFADLDKVVTVEKSAIVSCRTRRGLPDQDTQRRFGLAIARVFGRFAFPDDLQPVLRPFVDRIKRKHGRDSPEGKALAAIQEIRITGSPSWEDKEIDVFITIAPGTRNEADKIMVQEQWDKLVDGWLTRVAPSGIIQSVECAMIPLDELSARAYIDSDPLDLDYLSWPEVDTS